MSLDPEQIRTAFKRTEEAHRKRELEYARLLLRVKALPRRERETYIEWDRLRGIMRSERRIMSIEYDEADVRAREFLLAMLETNSIDTLVRHAANPNTFPKVQERYSLVPVISKMPDAYNPRVPYTMRGSAIIEPLGKNLIYLDAPYGFVLMYHRKNDNEKDKEELVRRRQEGDTDPFYNDWEPIALITVNPNWATSTLEIDQLQGGGTDRKRSTIEGKKSRLKFKKDDRECEEALYDIVRELALQCGFTSLGLRKASTIDYKDVKNADAAGETTVYKKIALRRKLIDGTGPYYIDTIHPSPQP